MPSDAPSDPKIIYQISVSPRGSEEYDDYVVVMYESDAKEIEGLLEKAVSNGELSYGTILEVGTPEKWTVLDVVAMLFDRYGVRVGRHPKDWKPRGRRGP